MFFVSVWPIFGKPVFQKTSLILRFFFQNRVHDFFFQFCWLCFRTVVAAGPLGGDPASSITSIIIIIKIRFFFLEKGLMVPPPPAQRAGGGGGGRNAGHPDPLPASVILHLASGCPLTGISGSKVQDDGGVGGGGLVGGVSTAVPGQLPWTAQLLAAHYPTISPSFPGIAPTIRPHIQVGGRSWEGGGDGWVNGRLNGSLNPPSPFPHPCCLPSSPPAFYGGSRQAVRVGVGALLGVFRLSLWVVGWALVPRTCPSLPHSTQESRAVSGASMAPGWSGGGGGGEDRAS